MRDLAKRLKGRSKTLGWSVEMKKQERKEVEL